MNKQVSHQTRLLKFCLTDEMEEIKVMFMMQSERKRTL